MASPVRELSYGAVEIFTKESDVLGVGSYGKVCKAKCGQLPCAAKLLHDTMFGSNDPGIRKFVERFEQECQFLRAIKHPNIVQFLGTLRDPRSRRLVLLMELMDESLTRFLEWSTGPLPYHTQLDICHDVAFALVYLHSNDIFHRDLSSNNVLLIGEGSRAKVTDFGMSKLESMNPRMTPLTVCPGTAVYMPPEALVTPPRYSNKLDCFSHGVLTIQIATRQFPNPGDAKITVDDARSPTGKIEIPVVETNRRKKDIDLVAPDHPLLPLALHCLKDMDTERPSANELCESLATIKCEPRYAHSVEQCRKQSLMRQIQTLQQQLQGKDEELERATAIHKREVMRMKEQHEQVVADCLAALDAKIADCKKKEMLVEQLHKENNELLKVMQEKSGGLFRGKKYQLKLQWIHKSSLSGCILSGKGSAVVHSNTAYFSCNQYLYSYLLSEDKWAAKMEYVFHYFSLAVVNDKLTAIGGITKPSNLVTNDLLCLLQSTSHWKQLLPPMPTGRKIPAAVTTLTHLIVAGGDSTITYRDRDGRCFTSIPLSVVEVLDLHTLQWSSASSLRMPSELRYAYPHTTLCDGYLYLSRDCTIFSCSVEELLKSCKPPSTNSIAARMVTRLTDIPIPHYTSLATLSRHVLAIGGHDGAHDIETVYCYDKNTNSWSVVAGEMRTPRHRTLVAVDNMKNKLIVAGGIIKSTKQSTGCGIMEIVYFTTV